MQSGAGNITNLSLPFTTRANGRQSIPSTEGEITLQDVVDTLNPLEHIPFLSTLYHQFTDSSPSAGSKLAGGALYGGPIGFIASLADVIVKEITGQDVGETVLAALTGEDAQSATQDTGPDSATQTATFAAPLQEVLPPTRAPAPPALAAAPFTLASVAGGSAIHVDTRVLDLYGGSQSANRAYARAQLRPYLQDVSQSMVL